MKRREFTEADVRAMIARLRDKSGGVRAMARGLGVSPSYVSDVLNGRRAPGPDFLKAVGIRKEVTVRYVSDRVAKD